MTDEKSVLRFANRAEVDFAEEALRALSNDHFDGVGYVFR
jgi:primase-polymerase (primpol)-like protein